jgi:hypothetical protein
MLIAEPTPTESPPETGATPSPTATVTVTATPTPGAGEQPDTDTATTDGFLTWGLPIAMVVIVLAGVGAILAHRIVVLRKDPERASDMRMTRPVLAIVLVGGLTLLATAAMRAGTEQVQLLLLGGVVSLSSAVVAFYFSSSGAADARKDLLAATMGTAQVPNLVHKRVGEARTLMSGQGLALVSDPVNAKDMDVVTGQRPPAGQSVAASTTVTVTAERIAAKATHGSPGEFDPQDAVPSNLVVLSSVVPRVEPDPADKWGTGEFVALGDKSQAHWDGKQWSAGAAP